MCDILANPTFKIIEALEKKLRNLEKRRSKLQLVKKELDSGVKLSEIQIDAISKTGEVELQIEYVKELSKLVIHQQKQYNRARKLNSESIGKTNQKADTKNLFDYLQYLEILKNFGKNELKNKIENFSDLDISVEDLNLLEKVGQDFNFSIQAYENVDDWEAQLKQVSYYLKQINLGTQTVVSNGLTGHRLKELLSKIISSQSFKEFKLFKKNNETASTDSYLNNYSHSLIGMNGTSSNSEILIETNNLQKNDINVSPNVGSHVSVDESYVLVNVPQNENHLKNEIESVTLVNGSINNNDNETLNNHIENDNLTNNFSNDQVQNNVNENNENVNNNNNQRNRRGYRQNKNFRRQNQNNVHFDNSNKNFKYGHRNSKNHEDNNTNIDVNQRDLNREESVENDGFIRAVNSKRKQIDNGSLNHKNNYRQKNVTLNNEQINGDFHNKKGDRPPKNFQKFNRPKQNNDYYHRNNANNNEEQKQPRFRQNYECGFRFAV